MGVNRAQQIEVKCIEDVQIGDNVWAWDEERTSLVRRQVVRLFRHRNRPILNIIVHRGEDIQQISATTEHPFWVIGKGWISASELCAGDFLKSIDDSQLLVVESVSNSGRCADVFNFEVSGAHNYFVGASGALVHNSSSDPTVLPQGTERFAFELEMRPHTFAKIVPEFDIDRLSSSTRTNLSIWVTEKGGGRRKVDTILKNKGVSPDGLSWGRKILMVPFSEFDPVTQARAIIQSHGDRGGSALKLRTTASERIVSVLSEYEWGRDADTMEFRHSDQFPQIGFDNVIPAAQRLVSIFPEGSDVTLERLAPNLQLHLSRAGVSLEAPAHAMSLNMVLKGLNRNDMKVLDVDSHTSYRDATIRGLVRLYDYEKGKINDRIEIRDIDPARPADDIREKILWTRQPNILYQDLAKTIASSPNSLDTLIESDYRSRMTLRKDLDILFKDPQASSFLRPTVQSIWDAPSRDYRNFLQFIAVNRFM